MKFLVPAECSGWRADRIVAKVLGVSRAVARELIDSGTTADGALVRPRDALDSGAEVSTPELAAITALEPEDIDLEIVHEDPCLAVVNKPSGMVVHPGAGHRSGTLAAALMWRYPEIAGVGQAGRWGLVHRLDRDTSGVLLVARNQKCYRALSESLKSRKIQRRYIAMVTGTFDIPTGTIEAPIGRDPSRPMRRAVVVDGKPSRTHYEIIEMWPASRVSLLGIRLDTGRTHQIRVHMQSIGHAVVGDHTYRSSPDPIEVPRIFLHAHQLELEHPATGESLTVSADLPADLTSVLVRLNEANDN